MGAAVLFSQRGHAAFLCSETKMLSFILDAWTAGKTEKMEQCPLQPENSKQSGDYFHFLMSITGG